VAPISVGDSLDEPRFTIPAGDAYGSIGSLPDSENVHAIYRLDLHIVTLSPAKDLRNSRSARDRSSHAIHVVLADIDDREPPKRSEIERFVERSFVYSAFSEEVQDYLVGFPVVDGKSHSCGQRHASSDYTVASHEVMLDVIHMHRASFAFGDSGTLPEEFGHDAPGFSSSSNSLPMLSISADYIIIRSGSRDEPDPDGLLTDVKVQKPTDLAHFIHLAGFVLELPDKDHLAIHFQQFAFLQDLGLASFNHG
jgi:hypothetical protein